MVDLAGAIRRATALGYTLFDTAEAYGTEPLLGALPPSQRVELRVVTKLWHTNHAPERVLPACEASLQRLRIAKLEGYLLHAPIAWADQDALDLAPGMSLPALERALTPRDDRGVVRAGRHTLEQTWAALSELPARGLTRWVGIANVEGEHLDRLVASGASAPAVVQVEVHPLRPQRGLLAQCLRLGIAVMAHSPFGGGAVLRHQAVATAATAAGVSPAHLVLQWLRWRGVVAVVGARDERHLLENRAAMERPLAADVLAAFDDRLVESPQPS